MQVIAPIIGRLTAMPVMVLAAQMCPDHVEATLFALLMGISNMSGSTGGYLGVGIIAVLNTYGPRFENLATFVAIRNFASLLPLVLIPYLCPQGSPRSSMQEMQICENKRTQNQSCSVDEADIDLSVISLSSGQITS